MSPPLLGFRRNVKLSPFAEFAVDNGTFRSQQGPTRISSWLLVGVSAWGFYVIAQPCTFLAAECRRSKWWTREGTDRNRRSWCSDVLIKKREGNYLERLGNSPKLRAGRPLFVAFFSLRSGASSRPVPLALVKSTTSSVEDSGFAGRRSLAFGPQQSRQLATSLHRRSWPNPSHMSAPVLQ